MAWRGFFKPKNPHKYAGDPTKIVYRSSLELRMMQKFDSSENVVRWASEEVIVPYFDPVKGRMRRYFPDFVIQKVGSLGVVETVMIEVKPHGETIKPTHAAGKRRSRIIREELTWANNQAKWAAAEEYCRSKGWTFSKITDVEIRGRRKKS
jgi:Straboviridae/Kyanoviridae head completion nuclease